MVVVRGREADERGKKRERFAIDDAANEARAHRRFCCCDAIRDLRLSRRDAPRPLMTREPRGRSSACARARRFPLAAAVNERTRATFRGEI